MLHVLVKYLGDSFPGSFTGTIFVFLRFSKICGPSKKFIKLSMKGASNENVTNYILAAFCIVIMGYGMKKLLVRFLGLKFAFQKNLYHAGVTWDSEQSERSTSVGPLILFVWFLIVNSLIVSCFRPSVILIRSEKCFFWKLSQVTPDDLCKVFYEPVRTVI